VTEIRLTKGKVTLVDDDDVALVAGFRWHYGCRGYAVRVTRDQDGRKKWVFLHRVLIDPPPGLTVDHIDGDRLNNRRANLRVATHSQQRANTKVGKNSKSGFKGVTWHGASRLWHVRVGFQGKTLSFGYYDDPIQAARVYDAKALELYGPFARLNFPTEGHPLAF
jgi:hypothetical protein